MGRIRGFDGLRALAVLAVFAGHRTPLHGHAIGHVGVLVFFALSGFLIVGILNQARLSIESGTSAHGAELRRFFGRRTRRIFPVYYAVLGGCALLALAGAPVSGWAWESLLWHLAYLSNVYEGLHGWQGSLSHLWSLSIEEWFYLLAAPLLLALPSRLHIWACGSVVALGLVSHLAMWAYGSPVAIYTDSLTNFGFLAFGGLLRLLSNEGLTRRARWLVWPLVPVLLALALVPEGEALGVWLVVTPILAALLVLGVAEAQSSRLVALLELPALAYMGRISYGFYLFHNLFWIETPLAGHAGEVASIVLNFAASLGFAALSWRYFEKPILKGRWPGSRLREQHG